MPKLSFLSGRAFDAGLAALAAVSAGFVAFAMPDPLFAGLVETSRLPDLVAAARPPLGDTARSAATGAAALGTFASVWALMALLGRRPVRREAAPEPAIQVPRQRRADAHPDAPPRPPLLARDLGEPLELDEVAPEPVEEAPFEEAPFEEAPFEKAEYRALPGFLVAQEPEPEPEPELEPEPVAQAEPFDPGPQPAAEAGPEPEAWATPFAGPEPEAEPEPDAVTDRQPEAVPIAELAARLPEGEPDEEGGQSLSQLVNRIEFGVSRKRQALPAVELPPAEPPSPEQEKVGHRLRSAISDLQKIASSGA